MQSIFSFLFVAFWLGTMASSLFAQSASQGSPAGRATLSAPAHAAVPLPRPRPEQAAPRPAAALPKSVEGPAAEPAEPSACLAALAAGLAEVTPLPPIAEANGCEAADVVRLEAVTTADRRRIPFSPPAVLRCNMATAIALWVREDLQELAAAQGAALTGLDNFNSFECRGRNRIVGAKISEHGRANALDIRAIVVSGGRKLDFTNPEVPRAFREAVRLSACRRFMTVLGPGSDGYHEDHVHVDLAERRSGYRLCQWDVRDAQTPLPRSRPDDAGPRQP